MAESVAQIQSSIYSNLFGRSFGGTTEPAVADPFISGYAYIWFETLPPGLNNYVQDITSVDDIKKSLSALCIRVTMPTETLNKTTITGLGGKKWSAATNIDVGDTVTFAFIEISGMPVRKIISGWVDMIRDIRTGTSQLSGTDYTKTKYSAGAYYITTKPDGSTIESIDYLTGLFPQKKPLDSYNFDVATNDKVEVDIDFNIDNVWSNTQKEQEAFLKGKASTYVQSIISTRQKFINWTGQGSE